MGSSEALTAAMAVLSHPVLSSAILIAIAAELALRVRKSRRAAATEQGYTVADQRLRLFFAQVPAAAWETDRKLCLTVARGSLIADLGFDEAALCGRHARELLPETHAQQAVLRAHSDALEGHTASYRLEISGRTLECRVEPLRGTDGGIRGVTGLAVDVTAWVAADRALRESDARNARMVANVPGVVYQYRIAADGTGRFTFASERSGEVLGISPATLMANPDAFVRALDPEDVPGMLAAVPPASRAPCSWTWEGRVVHPSGERRWMQLTSQMITEPDGSVVWDGLLVNVTERHRTASELQARLRIEEMLSQVASALLGDEAPLDDVVRLLGEGMSASRAYLYRYDDDGTLAALRHGWFAPWAPASEPPAAAVDMGAFGWCRETFSRGEPMVVPDVELLPGTAAAEHGYLRRRGIRSMVLFPLKVRGGSAVLGFIGLDMLHNPRDWTEHELRAIAVAAFMVSGTLARAHAEEALRESERHFRTLIENSADLILVVEAGGEMTYVSPSVRRVLGYESDEVLGTGLVRHVHPDDAPAVAALLQQISTRPGAIAALECRARDRRGEWRALDVVVQNRFLEAGGVVVNARDITERKAREADLRDHTAALQNAVEGIARIDCDGMLASVNQACAAMLGGEPDELLGTRWADWIHADDRAEVLASWATLQADRKLELDLRVERRDGVIVFARTMLLNAYDEEGRPTGWHCFMKDVTAWKQLNAQLERAQKLEAIGQLAAGVAHEINTPVQYVGDNVRFLGEAFSDLEAVIRAQRAISAAVLDAAPGGPADVRALARAAEAAAAHADVPYLLEEMPRAAAQAMEGLSRVAEIVRAMKEFSHPGTAERSPVDLNRAIQSTLTVARNEWKYVAELVTDFDAALPPVPCLPGDFNQVVLNLVVNAAHAITEKVGDGGGSLGTITVSTRWDGEWAEVRVADTGVGIPESARGRIFDPFFTTKAIGRGTGQGLTLAHAVIVEKHGGTLRFETETGRGTTFIIRLPLHAGREAVTRRAA